MPVLLNAKHEFFAHRVAEGMKPVDAYVLAGYSKNGADQSSSKLLKKTEIQARVTELMSNIAKVAIEKTAISKTWVLEQLVENVRMAKAAEPVLDNEGNPIGEYKQNLAAGNRALELIGKEIGMFVDRKEIRTGPLDAVPFDEKVAALDMIQAEIKRRKQAHESGGTVH